MNSPDYITHAEIRERAHAMWERSGRRVGKEEEHWLAAEQELQREREALPVSDADEEKRAD